METFVRRFPPAGPIRAVVLDWAGTAVDFGCMGPVAAFVQAFALHGVEVSLEEARSPMGKEKREHVRLMFGMSGVADRWKQAHGEEPSSVDQEKVYADVEELMVRSIENHATPVPGLIPFVEALRRKNVAVGSCTGYTAPMMARLHPAAARQGYAPDAVVCSSDVPAGRPQPWMCYLNAMRLGIQPLETMVKIGDTIPDIQEGLAAGMWTVGVTRTSSELGLTEKEVMALSVPERSARLRVVSARLAAAGAHYVVESVAECLPVLEDINARLARGESPAYATYVQG